MPVAEHNKRLTIVIPDWMDEVIEGASSRLGISKSKFAFWALVNAWEAAGLGFEFTEASEDLYIWAAETDDVVKNMERDAMIMRMEEEQRAEFMERLAKRLGQEKKSKKPAKKKGK